MFCCVSVIFVCVVRGVCECGMCLCESVYVGVCECVFVSFVCKCVCVFLK